MKKVIFFLIICLVCSASADAVTKKKKKRTSSFNYYERQYISNYAWAFHSPDGTGSIGQLGFMYIECDKNQRYWLKYECGLGYCQVEEITDENGREWLGMYNVYKGKHMYLKLDNDEIITLTCKSIKFIHNGYFTGYTDVYKEYQIYSYFDLTQELINKLKEHKIVKMRCELRYEVTDMELDEDIDLKPKFEEAFNKYDEKRNEENQINELKSNPLSGF